MMREYIYLVPQYWTIEDFKQHTNPFSGQAEPERSGMTNDEVSSDYRTHQVSSVYRASVKLVYIYIYVSVASYMSTAQVAACLSGMYMSHRLRLRYKA